MKTFRITLVIVGFLVHESITKALIEKREASAEGSDQIIQTSPKENDAGISSHKQHTSHHHQAKHWGYRNQDKSILPKDWYKDHPKCYGTQQSPINIETNKAYVDENLAEINVLSHSIGDPNPEIWEMQNNGHSVVLYPKSHKFGFTAENSNYELVQMHFHWRGSEHYLNGHRYAAELHLVHRNLNDSNKFAVLGFFLEQSNQDNDMLEPIVDSLSEISIYNSKITINKLSLSRLIPFKIDKYYRYPGSLTTPSCDEVVEWFVIHEPVLTMSDPQILEFQSIEDKNGYPMLTNSRPVQEINERYVRKSFYGNGNLRIINVVSSEVNDARTNGMRLNMPILIILLVLSLAVLRIF